MWKTKISDITHAHTHIHVSFSVPFFISFTHYLTWIVKYFDAVSKRCWTRNEKKKKKIRRRRSCEKVLSFRRDNLPFMWKIILFNNNKGRERGREEQKNMSMSPIYLLWEAHLGNFLIYKGNIICGFEHSSFFF